LLLRCYVVVHVVVTTLRYITFGCWLLRLPCVVTLWLFTFGRCFVTRFVALPFVVVLTLLCVTFVRLHGLRCVVGSRCLHYVCVWFGLLFAVAFGCYVRLPFVVVTLRCCYVAVGYILLLRLVVAVTFICGLRYLRCFGRLLRLVVAVATLTFTRLFTLLHVVVGCF